MCCEMLCVIITRKRCNINATYTTPYGHQFSPLDTVWSLVQVLVILLPQVTGNPGLVVIDTAAAAVDVVANDGDGNNYNDEKMTTTLTTTKMMMQ